MKSKIGIHIMRLGLLILIIGIGCNSKPVNTDPNLIHVLSITDCDSLINDDVFQENSQMEWPEEKPKSIVEAVLLLDEMTNEFNDHCFKICDPIEFYMGFGMGIRNEWVHQGTEELRAEFFEELKVGHPDFTSGMIMYLYTQYISEGNVILLDSLGEGMKHDTMKTALTKYTQIENKLNKLKEKRH